MEPRGDVYAIRHGETEWSRSGRHTSLTDLPLTESGREAAKKLAPALSAVPFTRVLSSPLQRARVTCELAGLGDRMEIDPDLVEWNYGDYEGLTQAEIARRAPGWLLFTDGCPGGERPEQITTRVDRLIARVRGIAGHVAFFAHGHILRAIGARWIELPVAAASHLLLDTTTLSVLSYYERIPALKRWNADIADRRIS